tara:strand:+ start:1474 stop:1665 length:192 start_codon:yes stop_codon:yes gene_type:complete
VSYGHKLKERRNKMTDTKKGVECWAGRYERRDLALEISRNTPGILTMAEALKRADAVLAKEGK